MFNLIKSIIISIIVNTLIGFFLYGICLFVVISIHSGYQEHPDGINERVLLFCFPCIHGFLVFMAYFISKNRSSEFLSINLLIVVAVWVVIHIITR